MSEQATPAAQAPAAEPAAAPQEQAQPQQQDTTAPLQQPAAEAPVPGFVQSAAQPQPAAQPTDNPHAPAPELVSGDWREMIPRELRQESVWDKYHSPEQAFKGLVELNKLVGKKEIPVGLVKPDPGAPQEDVAKYKLDLARMLEVPDSAERYSVPEIAKNVNGLNTMMQMAHKSGLGDQQFSSMIEQIAVADKEHQESIKKQRMENLNALRGEWGESYEQNLQVADVGLEAVDANGEMRKLLNDTGLNVHPVVIKHYHELGAVFREGNLKTGAPSTAETLNEEIAKLKKSDAYWEQGLDGGATRRKVDELMKQAGRR